MGHPKTEKSEGAVYAAYYTRQSLQSLDGVNKYCYLFFPLISVLFILSIIFITVMIINVFYYYI